MVQNIPSLLIAWWNDLAPCDRNHVRRGSLLSLLNIQPNRGLIKAATMFWDEKRVVFRFGNIEMTPLLKEIGGFAKLLWDSPGLLVLENLARCDFLKMLGFKKNDERVCLRKSYTPFEFLYECYGHSKSYRLHHEERAINFLGLVHRRVYVFVVYLLGLLIFTMQGGRIHTRLAMVVGTLMEGIEGQKYTIIPVILDKMYRAVDQYKHGFRHFEGYSLIL